MAISGISQTPDPSYRLNSPTVTPAPAATTSPVDKADTASIASAVSLGDMSSIVSTLGQNYSGAQVYNAAGLLNSIATAGQSASAAPAVPAKGTDIPSYEQDLTDFAVVGTLSSSTGSAGIYTPSGSLQDLPLFAVNDNANGNIINTLA
ncbi:MAG TPA: hypothetical protein VGM52_12460 [Herbaspirillum sp.]|jgi:hypothetical protein